MLPRCRLRAEDEIIYIDDEDIEDVDDLDDFEYEEEDYDDAK